MTDRENTSEQLSAYLDGELSPDESAKLQRRIEAEPELAEELARLKAVRDLVRSLPQEKPGADFAAGVLHRAQLMGAQAGRARWARYLASAAVVLVVIGLGTVAFLVSRLPEQADEAISLAKAEPEGVTAADEVAPVAVAESVELAMRDVSEVKPSSERLRGRFGVAGEAAGRGDPLAPEESAVVESFLAGQRIAAKDRPELVLREVVYTDDMQAAQMDLERVFVNNRLSRVELSPAAHGYPADGLAAPNVYEARQAGPDQVQYVVLVERAQLSQLQSDLHMLQSQQLARAGVDKDVAACGQPIVRARAIDDDKGTYVRTRVREAGRGRHDSRSLEFEDRSGGVGKLGRRSEAPAPPSQVGQEKLAATTQPVLRARYKLAEGERVAALLITLNRLPAADKLPVPAACSQPASKPVRDAE